MKRILVILTIALISSALPLAAQPAGPGLVFEEPEWDFGTVEELGGPVTHRFEAVNRGETPAVIVDATATCGCTKPVFSRRPVMPGERTVVEVTFYPAGQPGAVDKRIAVYGADGGLVERLRIRGQVHPRPRSLEERYPVEVGGGIRLTNNYLPFDRLPHDRAVGTTVGIANAGSEEREIRFVPRDTSGWLTVVAPERLAPGEQQEVTVRYEIPAAAGCYGTVTDVYGIEVDGVGQRTLFTCRGTAVDAPREGTAQPVSRIGSAVVRFGEVPRRRGRTAGALFVLYNEGSAPLQVRAVELPEGFACDLKAGETVAPGAAREVAVVLDPARFAPGAVAERLLVVTDDPLRPVWLLRLAAMVR